MEKGQIWQYKMNATNLFHKMKITKASVVVPHSIIVPSQKVVLFGREIKIK